MIQLSSVSPNPEGGLSAVTKPDFQAKLKQARLGREFALYCFINKIARR